ncbi:hypothetical protein F5Y02DRAFT_203847 [Annulohypoxylon stygium]|nr:hypothetical protein F5Y02DRAFT_203847 [Annulohypoxylon stygium]
MLNSHSPSPLTIPEWKAAQVKGGGLARLQKLVSQERASNERTRVWISLATDEHIEDQWKSLSSEDLPLYGVPFAVKDNIDAETFPTTAACPAFSSRPASEDAPVVKRLKAAGAILIGKTNLDQFATGLVGTRSPYGAVPNSFDPTRVSGGSSSGSAVSVSRGAVPFSLGTDTAGSGRVPAGLNNIYGLKPTRGAISARGVVPACRSLDCVSIFALTIDDAEIVLRMAEGFDVEDAYSRTRQPLSSNGFGRPSRGRLQETGPTLAICKDPRWFGNDEQAIAYEKALKKCIDLGWRLTPIDFSNLFALAQLLYEGPWVAERYAAIRDFFNTSKAELDPTVRSIISRAESFSAADTFSAEYMRQDLTRKIHGFLESFDGLLVPTCPTFPTLQEVANDPVHANSKLGTYTNFVNFLDWTAISIPAGFRSDGLPFGITLIANTWQEPELISLARQWSFGEETRLGATKFVHTNISKNQPESNGKSSDPSCIEIAVVGAHLRNFPLNKDLTSRGAAFQKLTTTSAAYRLFALPGGPPKKPGLRRTIGSEHGREIEVEVWRLPRNRFANFMDTISFPLGIGKIELRDHTWVNGFVCEQSALINAFDITDFGGWRAYTSSLTSSPTNPLGPRPIKSVLIANRGEIAWRILRTLRRMKIKTIAIYTDEDATTPHVREADVALRLEGNSVADTYLNAKKIAEFAKTASVDAVIPGYGFLSENADFAKLIEEQGIIWVGPTPDQMSELGLKHRARVIADQVGVPIVPGSPELVSSLEDAISEAERIGFPLMLKSTAGGGGIGLRHCADMQDLKEAFKSVQRLARANFADGGIFLERFIRNARHVEVQILGDDTGRVLAAGERDCSLQRRHQKVLEESPALMVPAHIRAQMRSSAVRLASAVKYRSVGTVEFIYDIDSRQFYFLEVNTRLQVEHPVTESVTGLDLVQCMIEIASRDYDELFTHRQEDIITEGVSIEARIYAEDPIRSFKPCSGRISRADFPKDLRVDSWIEVGTEVSTSYDPMIAKLIATGKDRNEAIEKLARGLEATTIDGVQNNLDYLRQIVKSDSFHSGSYTTKTLDAFQFISPCVEILNPGGSMTVQDFPGRVGFWNVGVPPSGPMDNLSFRIANQLVSNQEDAAAFECTMSGPTIKFCCDTTIAITGAQCLVQIDGATIPMYQSVPVRAGQIVSCGSFENGYRLYIAIAGGIDVPSIMGSKATFALAGFGGFQGRCLESEDFITIHPSPSISNGNPRTAVKVPIPSQPNAKWTIGVVPGPHGAPDMFTPEGLQALFGAEWNVHYNSNRSGIRLKGVRPEWARQNGGEAGLHPSNIHDAPYSIGSISFTGDEAVVLSVDGPSLGGFVVFCVVSSAELWKLGQVRPGDSIKLQPITVKKALELENLMVQHLRNPESPHTFEQNVSGEEEPGIENSSSSIGDFVHRNTKIVVRQAGDNAMLMEFGDEKDGFQIHQSFEIFTFIQQHQLRPIPDVLELTPGIRSLHVRYTSQSQPQSILSDLLEHIKSYELPKKVQSRDVRLPFAFDDSVSQAAVSRYSATIRSDAPWLPSNVKFLEQLNGIDNLEEIFKQSLFLVLGLGDVYLGSPCAVSLDPRCRLFGTKYNPSRSFTPRGAVGLGGQYLCIYAMDSPGGYQLVGRTTDIWNPARLRRDDLTAEHTLGPASTDVPWLFCLFDRITFYPVSESDIDTKDPSELVKISESFFDIAEYEAWLAEHQDDISHRAECLTRSRDGAPFIADLIKPYDGPTHQSVSDSSSIQGHKVRAPMPGRCWKLHVTERSEVKKGTVLAHLECSKMEIELCSPVEGICVKVNVQEGSIVQARDELFVIDTSQASVPV